MEMNKECQDPGAEQEMEGDRAREDRILDYAIEYKLYGRYPEGLSKDKKRAVRKRMKCLTVENGEVYIERKKSKVIDHSSR